MNENYAATEVNYAVLSILNHELPNYSREMSLDSNWRLFILEDNRKILIGEDSQTDLDDYQKKHLDLIKSLRGNREIKELANLRRKFSGLLKQLEKDIRKPIDQRRLFTNTFCTECPE